MTPRQALSIVEALAAGVDPSSGEALPDAHPLSRPDVIRALHLAVKGLETLEEKEKRQQRQPEMAGQPWTPEEDERLAQGFDGGIKLAELARQHGRSEGAIRSRLLRLGKLAPDQLTI